MKQTQEPHSYTPCEMKIVQFGEGNFLRTFVDYSIDTVNEKGAFSGDVAVVKSISFRILEHFHKQSNLYTVSLHGRRDGESHMENHVVTCINQVVDTYGEYEEYVALAKLPDLRFVVSNMTGTGIIYDETNCSELAPPNTYPDKLTKFPHERYGAFSGARDKSLITLPVELVEDNGGRLYDCVNRLIDLWELSDEFKSQVTEGCVFCNMLVNRIVSGYPRREADMICEKRPGYQDELLDAGEPFALWVIESDKDISGELSTNHPGGTGVDVISTGDQKPYHRRKARILSGAHTSCVLAAYLTGKNIMRDAVQNSLCRELMGRTVFGEIVPAVKLLHEQTEAFANSVLERFDNSFADHETLSIAPNLVSRWKSHILPTFKDQYATSDRVPKFPTLSFAALLAFYIIGKLEDGVMVCLRGNESCRFEDDEPVMEFLLTHCKLPVTEYVYTATSYVEFRGGDLTKYGDFTEAVAADLEDIRVSGMTAAIRKLLEK